MKVMTLTERLFKEWLLKNGYTDDDIKYNHKSSPDFILSDGRRIEVKRPMRGYIYFTRKQWLSLDDDVEIAIVHEDYPEPIAIVPFREFKEAYRTNRKIECGGKVFGITVDMNTTRIIIRCRPETKKEWEQLKAMLGKDGEEVFLEIMHVFKQRPRLPLV